MPEARDILHWVSLTSMIDETKRPSRFIRDTLFSREEPQATENIEFSLLIGSRQVAPFVRRDAAAVEVSGYQEKSYTVIAPRIRIKRSLKGHEVIFQRSAAFAIYVGSSEVQDAGQRKIAQSTQRLVERRDESIEYLCAQALRGSITYAVDEEDSFTVTFPRTSSHNITLTTFWDQANSKPSTDFQTAMQLVADDASLGVTDAIMGASAMSYFLDHTQVLSLLDNRRVMAGELDLSRQFLDSGALYLGMFRGIRVWGYTRATSVPGTQGDGGHTSFDLIRSKYVEFVSASPAAENTIYYGAINDLDAFEQGVIVGRSFSKSWKQQDPSVLWHLLESRPLPVMRRPDSTVSMKVISG